MSSNCTVTPGRNVCVPTISIQDAEFGTIEDINRDGYICADEVSQWLGTKYDDAWGSAVFPICGAFDKERAIAALKRLRPEMSNLVSKVSNRLFSDCPVGVEGELFRGWQASISGIEKSIIDYTIPAAADKGAGQLGFSWYPHTGRIASIRQNSEGAKGGLKVGDKIISVDGFKYSDTAEYKRAQLSDLGIPRSWLPDFDTYEDRQKIGVPANSLFFGPCGSIAKVEIERDGKRMTLEIKRGRG